MSEVNNMEPKVENLSTSNKGYELHCEYRNFPVTFVNALRRIVRSGVPTVVVRDVQILENTTQLPHEMLKKRVELLPVNVSPDDASTVRESKIELRVLPDKKEGVRNITTDDFVVESNRGKILMRDRDFDTPGLFVRVRPGESVHIKGKLAIENKSPASQVSLVSVMWHIDPEMVKEDRRRWVEEEKKDPKEFDNFYYQYSYSRYTDESLPNYGRPNWLDMNIESVGVIQAKEILRYAVRLVRKQIQDYVKNAVEAIQRTPEQGSYKISLNEGGHTVGALMQEVCYGDMNVDFVSYDIPHPLREEMVIRFHTKRSPESVLRTANDTIEEYCAVVEKAL